MMKKFINELTLILGIAFGFPTVGVIALAPFWWECDGRFVLWGYLTAVLVLFALCLTISYRDEMDQNERGQHGRR